jgi:hypothetical protein
MMAALQGLFNQSNGAATGALVGDERSHSGD